MKKNLIIALVIVVVLVIGWMFIRGRNKQDGSVTQLFTTVSEGPLVINLTESGSIKPADQIIIKSQVEGRAAILYLVPEGQRVKKGDVLVELDSSTLQDNLVNQEITVQNAKAAYIQAEENLEVVKNQANADIEKARLNLRFAKEDLIKYKEGEFPKSLNELESKVTLADEELQRAQDKLKWSAKLFEEKYLSETEYKSDQLSCRRCQLELATAKGNLALLQNYTYKRQIAQLESDVHQDEMALERTERSAKANVVQAETNLRSKELELNKQNTKLEKIRDQIAKSTITAPTDGLVIYATSNQGPFRGNTEPLKEGQEVRERQELIVLPTADTFTAEIKVHETNLKKLYPGLPVRIRVDALPGQVFLGKISRIALLPDAQSAFMNPDLKLYNTMVDIEGGGEILKSGMNCEAEIVIEQYEKSLYVPVQCVVRLSGKPVVYVRKGENGTEKRDVEIGLDNNRMVRIVSGLKKGEEVLLTPPLENSVSARATEQMFSGPIPPRSQAQPPAGGGAPPPPGGDGARRPPAGNFPGGTPPRGNFPRGNIPGGTPPAGAPIPPPRPQQ